MTIIPTSRNKKWYLEKGYPEVPYLSPLEINSQDISHHSKALIHWKCDYCGEIQESKAFIYFTQERDIVNKDCCVKCAPLKAQEVYEAKTGYKNSFSQRRYHDTLKEKMKEKYGAEYYLNSEDCKQKTEKYLQNHNVSNVMHIPEVKENLRKTVQKIYGVDCCFQSEKVKEKIRETNLVKYGFSNANQNPEIKEKNLINHNKGVEKNGTAPISKEQARLCELFGCKPNKLMTYYFLDGYFEKEQIYFEYNGSGHDLPVQIGTMTENEFKAKETRRYYYLKTLGLKEFCVINTKKNKVPVNDEIMLKINDFSFREIKKDTINWVIVDFDNGILKQNSKSGLWKNQILFNKSIVTTRIRWAPLITLRG